jgi:ABC-type lipoprotein export system ATPase subunit
MVSNYAELAAATAAVRIEAAELLTAHEDAWTPIAQQLATWAELKQRAQSQCDVTKTVHAAANWVKENIAALRNQRMEPLAKGARAIWAKLRQESNVELGAISLEGQSTRRRVELLADVDGEETRALSVMSRGELHALALALFLPRATMQASPLRFVVLDDPVQAMDPAKVDGFAQVLAEIAQDRQVVVFSHDDRLADAVRRIDPHARIVEVTRAGSSKVHVTDSRTPAYRYVDDARALASDQAMDPGVKAKVLPGLCRLALEAATHEVFVRARYLAGHDRASTEDTWQTAKRTTQKVALALYGDAERDVTPWRDARSWRKATLDNCGRGAHVGIGSDPRTAVDHLEKTVTEVLGAKR